MRAHKDGCMSDTCQIPETWRTPRKSFKKNITKKQSPGNRRRARNLAELELLTVSLLRLPQHSHPSPNQRKNKFPGAHEKSVAVLSKLKDMEFHSKANIETLAQLTLTIEDELKQKEFSNGLGEVYSAQDSFHTKLAALIQSYEAKCESLKPSA